MNFMIRNFFKHKIWLLIFFNIRGTFQDFVFKEQREIVKDKYLATVTIPIEYEISFEIFITSYLKVWTNAIHFTNSNDCCDYGSRVPSLSVNPNQNTAQICSSVNGSGSYCFATQPLPLMQWIKVTVKQFLTNSDYFYSVLINDETVHSVKNTKVSFFDNVKVFISNPWVVAQPGYIRNLYVPTLKADTYSFYRDLRNEATLTMSDVIKNANTLIIGADAIATYMHPSNEAYDPSACIFTCLQNANCYSLSFSQVANLCMLFGLNIRYNVNFFTININWDSYVL
ncbi:uncharacterized protein LOC105848274 [Hydra vulgaris]|uniref:uncharacterized protein LOC105848274 n=1 Tax=Hydra vulgaris TaxID=6087 RepID=UPI001F5F14DB|nr:uncharacterized protein LOC105848274 [Hydra vulgaris]